MKEVEEQQSATVSDASPSEIITPVILKANIREELDTKFNELKSKHNGHTLTAGAVAHAKENGTYILRVDII